MYGIESLRGYNPTGEAGYFLTGMGLWLTDTLTILPGLITGFCQVMLLLAIAGLGAPAEAARVGPEAGKCGRGVCAGA